MAKKASPPQAAPKQARKAALPTAAKPSPKSAAERAVASIPAGHPRVSPYLVTTDAGRVIGFLERVVDAQELFRLADPSGKIMHAEVRLGDSVVMLAEAGESHPAMPSMLHIYVEDVDAAFAKALAAGATTIRPPSDQFYGDRSGGVKDHAGNQWWFGQHVEDLSHEEVLRRAAALGK